MHDKPFTVGLYLLAGLLLAFVPILAQLFQRQGAPRNGFWSWLGLWGGGSLAGLLLGLTLPWWRKLGGEFTHGELVGYLVIVAATLGALGWEARAAAGRAPSPKLSWTPLALGGLIALLVCFTTGIMGSPAGRFTAWHHWGAYIAPAQMMLAGARIFVDFPAQYGFGPTALIAGACGAHCYHGMYYVAGGASFLFVLVGLMLVIGLRLRTTAGIAAISAAFCVAGLFWVSYAPNATSPLVTPSVTGLRFLPALGLAAALWWTERSPAWATHWTKIGFALYALGVLWSPESLFMSTAIWGPYYCLRRLAEASREARLKVLILSLVQLGLALVAIGIGFMLIYRLWLGVFPGPRTYFAYILFPPGPMPINPKGPVWFFVAALGLGAWAGWGLYRREGNSTAFRGLMLLLLLGYASISYALGRSHDNNFLNLLPYAVLLLGGLLSLRLGRVAEGLVSGMLASVLGLMALFGWSAWGRAIETGRIFDLKPKHFVESLSYEDPSTQFLAPQYYGPNAYADLPGEAAVIREVRRISKDPVSVVDSALVTAPDEGVWHTLHGLAGFTYIPADYKRRFLISGAARLKRSGWLITHQDLVNPWLTDFQTAYVITEERDFGPYRAFHFAPKP